MKVKTGFYGVVSTWYLVLGLCQVRTTLLPHGEQKHLDPQESGCYPGVAVVLFSFCTLWLTAGDHLTCFFEDPENSPGRRGAVCGQDSSAERRSSHSSR